MDETLSNVHRKIWKENVNMNDCIKRLKNWCSIPSWTTSTYRSIYFPGLFKKHITLVSATIFVCNYAATMGPVREITILMATFLERRETPFSIKKLTTYCPFCHVLAMGTKLKVYIGVYATEEYIIEPEFINKFSYYRLSTRW